MESKYLDFKEFPNPGKKTKLFIVYNKSANEPLGRICFLGAWRKYVFVPEPECAFDEHCLADVSAEIVELTKAWREGLKNGK